MHPQPERTWHSRMWARGSSELEVPRSSAPKHPRPSLPQPDTKDTQRDAYTPLVVLRELCRRAGRFKHGGGSSQCVRGAKSAPVCDTPFKPRYSNTEDYYYFQYFSGTSLDACMHAPPTQAHRKTFTMSMQLVMYAPLPVCACFHAGDFLLAT